MRLHFFPDLPEASGSFPAQASEEDIKRASARYNARIDEGCASWKTIRKEISVALSLCQKENTCSDRDKNITLCVVLARYIEAVRFFKENILQEENDSVFAKAFFNFIARTLRLKWEKKGEEPEYPLTPQQAFEIINPAIEQFDKALEDVVRNKKAFFKYQLSQSAYAPPKGTLCSVL